ncbi:hypothetical protein C5E16_06705 [Clavibacter michiganensis]|uniref:Integral membrane protein n=1 Tax=Clavibacter michiganensis TaxID=28447 RepID=A0A2S5VV01_9MICO|nr:hypothetical protein C5E16_06705 [Clavibacter michiganensis]
MKGIRFALLGLALTGALISGAAVTVLPAESARAQDTASDLAYAKCHYGHSFESCQFLAEQGNIPREGLRCLAASGIAVAGLFIGEGVGEGLATAIARKYLAAGAFGCLSTFL